MTAHTPGPWGVAPSVPEEGSECFWVYSARGQIGCVNGPQNDEQAANANLIAAAPDLLAALEAVMTAHGEQLETAFAQAQEAIAKAKA